MSEPLNSQGQLIKAVQRATRVLASSGNFDVLVKDVLTICVDAVGATGGTIYLHDPANERLRFEHVLPESILELLPSLDIPDDFGIAGDAFQRRQTVLKSFAEKPREEWNAFEIATGVPIQSIIATPLMLEDEQPIGVVQLLNKRTGPFDETDVAVMDTVAAVSTMAYLNYRLTEESSRASTLLGMGKVSHDIGNLAASLYANVNFTEMVVEAVLKPETEVPATVSKSDLPGTFNDLKSSVDRIVGYSRLMSDMSAGRELRPEMRLTTMAETIRNAAAYLEPEARAHHIRLRYDIDEDAPPVSHDELYIFRIVQNLVGNAVKAVVETIPDDTANSRAASGEKHGEVTVRYKVEGTSHILEVSDTGPGMTQATANKILAGVARSQWDKGGGSGWGMKIVRELAATHAAQLSIRSELGSGATFTLRFSPSP